MTTITLTDGREFPVFDCSEVLSWSLGLYHTHSEEMAGFPRMRCVIRAMAERRPDQLWKEHLELLKGSFDQMFGHNTRKALAVVEEECPALRR